MRIPLLDLPTPGGPGSVQLERPHRPHGLVLLTHGAGEGTEVLALQLLRDALVGARFVVGLMTQPYRCAGRREPPPPAEQDRDWLALVAHAQAYPGLADLPLLVGGRGDGARPAARTARQLGALGVIRLDAGPPAGSGDDDVATVDVAGADDGYHGAVLDFVRGRLVGANR